jgi:hypothetical protein
VSKQTALGETPAKLLNLMAGGIRRSFPSCCGTMILATKLLNLADPLAVEQVNRVGMSLAELGLLPVIDPTAM